MVSNYEIKDEPDFGAELIHRIQKNGMKNFRGLNEFLTTPERTCPMEVEAFYF